MFFSAAATKGWDLLHKHNAELLKWAADLRDLKLLVGSGGLDFHKNMDSLTNMSLITAFSSASPLANIGS